MELDWDSLAKRASLPLGADVAEPPTVKQVRFLEDLVMTKDVPERLLDEYYDTVDIGGLTKTKASHFIDEFLACPTETAGGLLAKRSGREVVPTSDSAYKNFAAEVESVPNARYAVPVDELLTDFFRTPIHGDLLFVEVKKRFGARRMVKLTGSPGRFSRTDLHIDDALAVLRTIARDPYEYTSLFARHYKVCGRCGAELTDPKSRDIGLGPECRKHFSGIPMATA